MKLLNSYKKIAKEFIKEAAWDRKFGEPLPTLSSVMKEAEMDDDKIIKYNDKEGESQEMTAGAAKKQPDDHPAKLAYNKMKDDSGDDKKDSGGKLGGGDFDRDANRAADDDADDMDRDARFDADAEDDEDEFSGPNPDDDKNLEDAEETVTYYEEELNAHQFSLQSAQNVLDDALEDPENEEDGIRRAKELLAKSTRGIKFSINKLKDANEKVKSFGGGEKDESIKVIDGKKYKAIKESKEPTKPTIHLFKETYKKIGGK